MYFFGSISNNTLEKYRECKNTISKETTKNVDYKLKLELCRMKEGTLNEDKWSEFEIINSKILEK